MIIVLQFYLNKRIAKKNNIIFILPFFQHLYVQNNQNNSFSHHQLILNFFFETKDRISMPVDLQLYPNIAICLTK